MKILTTCLGILLIFSLTVGNVPASYREWESNYSKAETLMVDGRVCEALSLARQSLNESLNRHGAETVNSVKSLELLSQLAQAMGKIPQAVRFQSLAYDLNKRLKGPENPKTISLLTRLAELTIISGNSKAGEACYREALAMCQNGTRSDCITTAAPMVGLAQFLASEGKLSEAENLYQCAISRFCCFSKYNPALKLNMAEALENLALISRSQGDYANAINCLRKSQKIYQSQENVPMEKLGQTLLVMGDTYAKLGKPERALKFYKEALAAFETQDGSPVSLGLALKGVGDVFRGKGNLQMASNCYKKAITQFETVSFVGKPLFADTVNSLTEIYREMGKESEAGLLQTKFIAMN
jgi:tetratricopeptide (TPR) repeat protein